jgi:prophage maintenance system killer protein
MKVSALRKFLQKKIKYNLPMKARLISGWVLVFSVFISSFSSIPALGFSTDCLARTERLVRQEALQGGFAKGITPQEMKDIAAELSVPEMPIQPLPGKSFEQVLINASYRNSFWEKIGVVIRDIAGGHLLNDGNHRMAFMVAKRLIERNGIVRSPSNSDEQIYRVISKVARGAPGYRTADEIAEKLRGY